MNINPAIIVLSAYDDYVLVREAFKLGIYDYVLKTEMEPDNILKLMLNAMKERKQIKQKSKELYKIEDKNAFLTSLLSGDKDINVEGYDIGIEKKNIAVCFLMLDDFKEIEDRFVEYTLKAFMGTVTNAIYQILFEIGMGEAVCISPEEYVILLSLEDGDVVTMENRIEEILQRIRHALSNYLNIKVTAGISSIMDGYENICTLYKEAESNGRWIREKKGSVSHLIKRAQQYIHSNYMKKITLEMVSGYVELSEGHFSKIFAKEVGETFSLYLTRVRMENAKNLLVNTNMKIYEICDRIGYENVEHFSRTFKKIAGISPNEYKRKG